MLTPNQILGGRYRILHKIAEGGQAIVYLAQDGQAFDRNVVVKEFKLGSVAPGEVNDAIKNFEATAALFAPLSHPNIAQVYAFFLDQRTPYLVTEFVPGDTLERRIANVQGGLGEQRVREWGVTLCDALTYLHSQTPPVIFRDLKPENIMLTPNNQLKLVDFGIARTFKSGKSTDTELFGTPGFAAPEQFGRGQTGAYSDVYSLGITLLRLTTGHEPNITPFAPPRADALRPMLSKPFADAIERATQVTVAARFQTAEQFKQALLTGYVPSVTPPVMPPAFAYVQPVPVVPTPTVKQPKSGGIFGKLVLGGVAVIGGAALLCVMASAGVFMAAMLSSTATPAPRLSATRAAALVATADPAQTLLVQARQTQEAIVALRSTQTAEAGEAEQTATAEAEKTATAEAEETAAAEAEIQATALATPIAATPEEQLAAAKNDGQKIWGPFSKSLPHNPANDHIEASFSDRKVENCAISVTWINPFQGYATKVWVHTIGFRQTAANESYRLLISSKSVWRLTLSTVDANEKVQYEDVVTGELSNLNTFDEGRNTIEILMEGDRGHLFVNQLYVSEIDLSAKSDAGSVWVGVDGDETAGAISKYEDFTIWELP